MFSTPPTKSDAVVLIRMVEEDKKLSVSVDSILPFEDAIAAYERLATMRARGRVVVKVEKEQKQRGIHHLV